MGFGGGVSALRPYSLRRFSASSLLRPASVVSSSLKASAAVMACHFVSAAAAAAVPMVVATPTSEKVVKTQNGWLIKQAAES